MVKMLLAFLFLSFLAVGSFSWASDSETSESSTAQSYYDSQIGYQQKQGKDMSKFKEGIGSNVTGLKEDISEVNSKVKSGELKYNYSKGSATLGSLYGSKGKLGLDKGKYNKGSAAAVTDTDTLEALSSKRQTLTGATKIAQPPSNSICTQVCSQVCTQVGYGRVCTPSCTTVCH